MILQYLRSVTTIDTGVDANRPDRLVCRDLEIRARQPAAEVRVAQQVVTRHQVDAQLVAVAVVVDPPEVIERLPPLPTKVIGLRPPTLAGWVQPGGVSADVQPVIVTPSQAVGRPLRVRELRTSGIDAHPEIRRDERLLIGFSIAVPVAAEPKVGRLAHEDPVAVQGDGPRQDEAVEEDGAAPKTPRGIRVREHDDPALRLILFRAIEIGHVALHLDDPQAPVWTEGRGDRMTDQRFSGDEFDPVAWRHLERAKLLLRERAGDGGITAAGTMGRCTSPALSPICANPASGRTNQDRRWRDTDRGMQPP